MMFPDRYAILDINVITAINRTDIKRKNEWEDYKTKLDTYKKYIHYMRKRAKKEKKKNLREVEFELFLVGKRIRKKEKKGQLKLEEIRKIEKEVIEELKKKKS